MGEILSRVIADTGTSQAAIARAVGLSESQISRALRGLKTLSLDEFESACIALGLEPVDVLAEADREVRTHRRPATVTKLPTRRAAPKPPLRRVAKKRSKDRGGEDGQG